jgi:hypothetical protein
MTRGHVGGVVLLCLALGGGACASRKESADAAAPPRQDTGTAAPRAEETPAMGTSLECAMSVTQRVTAGQPVELVFRLKNPAAQPLYVLNWHTPLEGLLSNCLKVTRSGVEIPYQGPMFKRGDPDAESYVTLAPGASEEKKIEASLAYDFSQPGTYRIEFRGPLMDVATQQAEVPRPLAKHSAVPVQCPAVETTIVTP